MPTLGGAPVTLKIPPGTPNGRTFRVRGKGVAAQGRHPGDLLVTVEVAVPAKLVDDGPRGGRGVPRRDRGRGPARRTCSTARRALTMPFTAGRDGAWETDDTSRSTSSPSPPS